MEKVWELKEGAESYGSVRGGIGREKVKFSFQLEKGGYFYFVASLPYALNEKGSTTLEKWKLQDMKIFRTFSFRSGAGAGRFSVDLRLRVFCDYRVIHVKEMVLDMGGSHDKYECFEIPSGFVPVTVEVELEGHSFLKKLKVVAEMYRYGSPPKNKEEKSIITRLAQYLLTSVMKQGEENYAQLMEEEKQKLLTDLQISDIFPGEGVQIQRSVSNSDSARPSTPSPANQSVVFEILATDTIGNAMFYLLDKGVLSAPVWDPEEGKYLGLFDIQDAMHFTLKLRELSAGKTTSKRKGDFLVLGVTVGESESSSFFGLDLPVSVFFREENRRVAPWVPVRIASPMKKILELLSKDAQRIPVVDNNGRVVKIISQSEIINQVFYRYIKPKLEPRKKEYFETTELNEIAVEEGVKPYRLSESVFHAFSTLMASTRIDELPIVNDDGELVDTLTPVDSWFLCRTEFEEKNAFLDLTSLTVKEFLDHANSQSNCELSKNRKPVVKILINTPLRETISKLVQHKSHGCFVCDEKDRPIGRVNVAHIVTALLVDDVGIFGMHENIASVFLWEKQSRSPRRPSVHESIKSAAERSKRRLVDSIGDEKGLEGPGDGSDCQKKTPLEQMMEMEFHGDASTQSSDEAGGGYVMVPKPNSESVALKVPFESLKKLDPDRFSPFTKDSVLRVEDQAAIEKHLPVALQHGRWRQVYAMRKDGANTVTLRDKLCLDVAPLVVALDDGSGNRFGGFLPNGLFLDESTNENGFSEGPSGEGESFVYSIDKESRLRVFRWSGKNRYFRLISGTRGFGMGGGGQGFAFYVDSFMSSGTSRQSGTFENDCLAGSEEFKCLNLEFFAVYSSVKRR